MDTPRFRLKLFTFMAMVASLVMSPVASAQFLMTPGSNFRINFDLSSAPLPPPYDQFQPFMQFDAADYIGSGDGFTAQLFDASGTALSAPDVRIFNIPDSFNLGFALPLFAPLQVTQGFIQFTDIVGSFALKEEQLVIGYRFNPLLTTGYLPATLQLTSVPEPSSYGALAGVFVLVLMGGRELRDRHRARAMN